MCDSHIARSPRQQIVSGTDEQSHSPHPHRARKSSATSRDNGVEFLFAQFVDMHGKPNAKLVPARHLDDLIEEGAGFAGFAAGAIGQTPHAPTSRRCPTCGSFTPLPWKPDLARFACDVTSRARRGRTARARSCAASSSARRELGFEFKIGVELEFFLVRERDGRLDRARRPARHARAALLRHARPHAQLRLHDRPCRATCNELGWDNYANDHEDANGQFESNFDYADALITLRPRDLLPLHGPRHWRSSAACSRRSCRSRSGT